MLIGAVSITFIIVISSNSGSSGLTMKIVRQTTLKFISEIQVFNFSDIIINIMLRNEVHSQCILP